MTWREKVALAAFALALLALVLVLWPRPETGGDVVDRQHERSLQEAEEGAAAASEESGRIAVDVDVRTESASEARREADRAVEEYRSRTEDPETYAVPAARADSANARFSRRRAR